MTVRVVLARNVRELRIRAGYSQSTLAAMAGMNRGHLSELETCKGNPSVDTLVALADCFDEPITRLFKGLEDAPPYKMPSLNIQ